MSTSASAQEQLAEALESPRCFCGNVKKMQRPFCLDCYSSLPINVRGFLYFKYQPKEDYAKINQANTYLAAIEWLENHGVKHDASKSPIKSLR